jgi:hypothetical protein
MGYDFGNDGQRDCGETERPICNTPHVWSKATSLPNLFSDAPRRFMKRETISVDRTLERTEKAVLEVKIAALQEMNDLLSKQLNTIRQERDDLRHDRDKWREMAQLSRQPVQPPRPSRRTTLWRLAG